MAVGKFSFYASFWDAASDLGDKERLALYDAMCAYVFAEKEPEFGGVLRIVWKLVKPNLESSKRGQETGAKGGRGRGGSAPAGRAGKGEPHDGEAAPEPSVKPPCKPRRKASEKPTGERVSKPPCKPSCKPDMDMERDMDRDMEGELLLPVEEEEVPPASGVAAAAGAAPPVGANGGDPACPLCGGRLWKDHCGSWHCEACCEAFSAEKVASWTA